MLPSASIQAVFVALAVAAFAGAGLFNMIGTPATRRDFARWGYPEGWHWITGALEALCAVLIAFPTSRDFGLALGVAIMAAAAATVLRHRAYGHLPPIGGILAIISLVAATS